MSQTYRIGSLSFTGSQAILSASLDVSGSGRFTDGLTVTGSFTVITGSSREFQVRNTGVDIGNIITDIHTVTGSLNISGSITGSLFGTASFALATAAAPASDRIATDSVTASVNTTGNIFTVASSSVNLMTVSSSGIVTIATSGSANTMRLYVAGGLYPTIETLSGFEIILKTSGQDRLKVADNVTTNVPLRFGTPPGGVTVPLIRPGASIRLIDMQIVAGLSGSVRGDILIQSGSLIAQGGEFRITTGSTDYLRVFPSTGNMFIGSTPVDGGFKLDVNGTTRLQGALMVSTGGATIIGNTTVTGSLNISGSGRFTDGLTVTGSINLAGSTGTTLLSSNADLLIITGSLITTGSIVVTGSVAISSGSVTMPNRPAFRVTGNSSSDVTATTILSGSVVTVDYNQGNHYNNTTGLFTAPIAGLYQVFLNARVGSANSQMQAIVYKNGGTVQLMWEAPGLAASTHFGVSGIVNLAVNDTLQVTVAVGSIQFDGNDSWGVAYIG